MFRIVALISKYNPGKYPQNDKGVDAGDFAIKIMPLTDKFCRVSSAEFRFLVHRKFRIVRIPGKH